MKFVLLIRKMPIQVTCKFEMLIFKSSQVIKYYVMFAFLFVQTVCYNVRHCGTFRDIFSKYIFNIFDIQLRRLDTQILQNIASR